MTAQSRSTTLNFDANGKQLKSVQVNQLGIPWFINVCTAIQGEITEANTNVGHLLKEVDFSPSGDGGSMQNIPFFQYDFEINNFNYTNKTAWYLALEANILGTLIDTVTEYLILEWDLCGKIPLRAINIGAIRHPTFTPMNIRQLKLSKCELELVIILTQSLFILILLNLQ